METITVSWGFSALGSAVQPLGLRGSSIQTKSIIMPVFQLHVLTRTPMPRPVNLVG